MSSITLEIIYQDNHLLAIDKPAGIPTQDSGSGLDNLEDQARQWVKEAAKKPGNVFLHAVHRLDRPVSGVVLFGRTTKALQRLNLQQREKQTRKVYLALLDRPPPQALRDPHALPSPWQSPRTGQQHASARSQTVHPALRSHPPARPVLRSAHPARDRSLPSDSCAIRTCRLSHR